MNFGIKITIALGCFMSLILFLVISSSRQKIDLVAENYYEQEIQFQEQIDKTKNTYRNGMKPTITHDQEGLKIIFKENKLPVSGNLLLQGPSDAKKDLTMKFNTEKGVLHINRNKLDKGPFLVRIDWQYNSIPYYYEEKVIL